MVGVVFSWVARKYRKKREKLIRRWQLGRKVARVLPLCGYAASRIWGGELRPPSQSVVIGPRAFGETAETLTASFRAIEASLLKNAVVCPIATTCLVSDRIVLPEYYLRTSDALISDGQFLRWHDNENGGIEHRKRLPSVRRGIKVFGSGSMNWYHWLIEILPSAYFSESLPARFQRFPLLVPSGHLSLPVFRQSLSPFLCGREVISLPHVATRVGELIVIDEPVQGPMNLIEGRWPVVADYAQNVNLLQEFRLALLSRLRPADKCLPKRLFLARGNNRRTYNQDEIAEIAARYGFEAVYPETMDFATQVALFNGAEAIIGPSGAAFANMLFCGRGARALTWVFREYAGFCAYSNLAHAVGVDLTYVFVESEKPLRSSFDAYGAPYRLDPREFENALLRMLKGDEAGHGCLDRCHFADKVQRA